MVLLHVLNTLAPSHGWRLSVAHFNHQLRGRSSDRDERFVRQTAKKLGLPALIGRANVRTFAIRKKISVEMAARELRHEFLASAAKSRGIRCLALAHHADDQVELFFLRLLRGAGSEGLGGMRWQAGSSADERILLARPLLDQPKSVLEAFSRERGIQYREDATNASTDILRNRIRLKLIPLLTREYQPALEKVLLRLMDIIAAESDFLNDEAARWLKRQRREPFGKLPMALQRICLRREILKAEVTPNFELVEKLRAAPDRAVIAGGGISLSRDAAGRVRISRELRAGFNPSELKVTLKGASGKVDFGGAHIEWKSGKMPGGTFRAPSKMMNREVFDAHKAGDCMLLRHWRAGDRFQPLGMDRSVKLQDLFTNAKIARDRRHELVVATTLLGEIIWVEGLRPGERFKLDKSSTRRLNWRWNRP